MKEYFEIAEALAPELRKVSDFIHSHPETGFKEYQSSARLVEFLRAQGFDVEYPYAGIETSFCATRDRDDSRPGIAVFCEYDALEGIGHACGHNLIATTGVCAACVAAEYARRHHLPMNLRCIGTPAEEGFSGKGHLLRNGAFKGLELAIVAHPWGTTETDGGALGVARSKIAFHGKAAHAGQSPELGINALDAMMYFYMDMLEWKKTILPSERVHGIVTNGGDAPNVIPDLTEASFYVRSLDVKRLEMLQRRLEQSVKLACEKSGCTGEVKWGETDQPLKVDPPLNEMYARFWHEAGKDIKVNKGDENRISTDMGTVSQVIRATQFQFSITGEKPCALHTVAFREAAASDEGFRMAAKTGAIMGRVLVENR